jgi:glycosyltransferase involved in cell wall biosynthesis
MGKRINILSVAWSLPGGGVSHYLGTIYKLNNLENIKIFQVVIRAPNWNVHQKIWEQIRPTEILIKNRADFRWLNRLLSLIKEKQIDILMVHDFNGFIIGGISRLFGVKIPILATYHSPYLPPTYWRRYISFFVNEYSIFFLRYIANRIITVSNKYRDKLIRRGVKQNKIDTVHNGIRKNLSNRRDKTIYTNRDGFSNRDLVFGTTSRLHPIKGLKYLIEAIPEVLNCFTDIQFVIFGTGPLKDSLKKQCVLLGIQNRIHFLGFQHNISMWLMGLDGFILPSLAEAHSIGLLEAMRANLPIICTPVGDNLETIEPNVDGLVVPEKNPGELARAILTLAKNPELRKTLGNSAKIKFENYFTEEKMLDKTLKIINDCVS